MAKKKTAPQQGKAAAKATKEMRGTPITQMRLEQEYLDALEAIAIREGLLYGGKPSRPEAVRWLVRRDRARQAEAEDKARRKKSGKIP